MRRNYNTEGVGQLYREVRFVGGVKDGKNELRQLLQILQQFKMSGKTNKEKYRLLQLRYYQI